LVVVKCSFLIEGCCYKVAGGDESMMDGRCEWGGFENQVGGACGAKD